MTVTVRRGSWHYKLWELLNDPIPLHRRIAGAPKPVTAEPKAICGYFWGCVLALPIVVALNLAATAAAIVIAPIVGLVYLGMRVRDSRAARATGSTVSIAGAYVAARKARVCPRVTVVES